MLRFSIFDITSAGKNTIRKIVGAKSVSGTGLNRDNKRLVTIANGGMNPM